MTKNIIKKKGVSEERIIKRKLRKKGFPFGIFLMTFTALALISAGAVFFYYIYIGRERISDIEGYTRNYSITMAEAFARTAELSYKKGHYRNLKSLFREKIEKNTIDEAFFVLKNGTIVVHSDPEIEKDLEGNIANDAFTYNIEMIMKPVKKKSRSIEFSDYNIISQRLPFNRDERMFLKRYIYDKIDTVGWLVSRAVFIKGRPVGTVNFIISKERIYRFLTAHRELSIRLLAGSLAVSFLLSFIISLSVFFRYRAIQRAAMAFAETERARPAPETAMDESPAARNNGDAQNEEDIIIPDLIEEEPDYEEESISIELAETVDTGPQEDQAVAPVPETAREAKEEPRVYRGESGIDTSREIKDAIPISGRSSR